MSNDQNTDGGVFSELNPEQRAKFFIELVAFSDKEQPSVDRDQLLKISGMVGPCAVSQCINDMVKQGRASLEIDEDLKVIKLADVAVSPVMAGIGDLILGSSKSSNPEEPVADEKRSVNPAVVSVKSSENGNSSVVSVVVEQDQEDKPDINPKPRRSVGPSSRRQVNDAILEFIGQRGTVEKGEHSSAGVSVVSTIAKEHGYSVSSLRAALTSLIQQGKVIADKVSPNSRRINSLSLPADSPRQSEYIPLTSGEPKAIEPQPIVRQPNKSVVTKPKTRPTNGFSIGRMSSGVSQERPPEKETQSIIIEKLQQVFDKCDINQATERLVMRALAHSDNFTIDVQRDSSLVEAVISKIYATAPQGSSFDDLDTMEVARACHELNENLIISYSRNNNKNDDSGKVVSVSIQKDIVDRYLTLED